MLGASWYKLCTSSHQSVNNIYDNLASSARLESDDIQHYVDSIMKEFKNLNANPAHEFPTNFRSKKKDFIRASLKTAIEVKLPILGSTHVVTLSHVVNPLDFYVQCSMHLDLINEISRESKISKNKPAYLSLIAPGKVLIYSSSIDEMNYRVFILEKNFHIVKVKFMDFGQIEEVPIKSLSVLHHKYVSVPPLALHCTIDDLTDESGWTSDDITFMQSLVKSKRYCTMYLKQIYDSSYKVDLMIDGQNDLREVFSASKLNDSDISIQPTKYVYPEDSFPLNVEVNITCVISPTNFYVRKVSIEDRYNIMSNELNLLYNECKSRAPYSIKNGHTAACFSPKLNCWARCRILNVTNKSKILVKLIDSGIETFVEKNELQFLPNKFREIEVLAKKCSLYGVRPINKIWCANAIKLLNDCSNSCTPSTIKLKNDKTGLIEVEMQSCVNGNIISVGDELVKRKYAQYEKTDKFKPKTYIPSQKQIEVETTSVVPLSIPIEDEFGRIPVKVMLAVSPSEIYVTLLSAEALMMEISERMQKFYKTAEPNLKMKWKVNDKCAVESSQIGQWCRGLIVELNEEERSCKVFLKDVAVWEKLAIKDLYRLTSEFLSVKDGTVKCSLSGIKPALGTQWPNLSCEYLQDITSNYSKYAICDDGMIDNKSLPIELWVLYTDPGRALEPSIKEWRRVNDMIVYRGFAIWDKNNTEVIAEELQTDQDPKITPYTCKDFKRHLPKLPLAVQKKWKPPIIHKNEYLGIPTNVDDDFNIYIINLAEKSTLEYINTYIMEQFENSSPQPEDMFWGPDQPCIAQFSRDDKFYRGQTIKTLENNCMLVRFIDYGNDEICPISTLRKNIVLEEIPVLALKCKVVGVRPKKKKWQQSQLDTIHQTVVEKECYINVLGTDKEADVIYITLDLPNVMDLTTLMVSLDIADYVDYPEIFEVQCLGYKKVKNVEDDPDIIVDSCLEISNLTPILKKHRKFKFPCRFFKCNMVDIVSINSIILKIADDYVYSSLHENVNKVYRQINALWPGLPIFNPKLGICCIACAPDDSWGRGEVYHTNNVSVDDPAGLVHTVNFIDSGICAEVLHKNVKETRPNWVEVPPLTIVAKLNCVSLADNADPNDVVNMLKQMMGNLDLYAKITCNDDEVIVVELFNDSTKSYLVYQPLIDDGLILI